MKKVVEVLLPKAAILVLGVTAHSAAVGAPPAVTAAASDDLRAAYATVADIAEGKRLAESSCSRCHGLNGISTTKGVPHIAGQRPVYQHIEMRAYQTGARGDNPMAAAVKFLSSDALIKVAAYYASLEPAQPGAAGAAKGSAGGPDPVKAGAAAAAGCAGCHGEGGVSKTPGMPNLVGIDQRHLVAAMKAYKGGQRKHDMMKTLLAALSDSDLNNIALYYALQKPRRAQTPAPGNQAAGKAAAASCGACHGDRGVSANPTAPSLAGQDAQYFAVALQAYRDGSRGEPTMKGAVASLEDRVIKDLAAFYAAQAPQPPKAIKPLSVAEWAQRCDRCHGVNGNSADLRLPALAAQRVEYLEMVIRAYQKGARKSPQMHAMTDVLSEADVANLSAHYARQRARAFVYLMLPGK